MNKIVKLNKDTERRIKAGHLWIYSNEIDTKQTPLKDFSAGELVQIETAFGKTLGIGYINPQCLLCIRVLTKNPEEQIDETFFEKRIQIARAKRQLIFSEPYYRVVFGESDHLPGLVVDQFNDYVVIQINTAGMERLKEFLIAAIKSVLQPQTILLKCDSSERQNEGLTAYTEVVYGKLPESILVKENNCQFNIPALSGQKTGWFFDHRSSRQQIARYCQNKRVLDVFSYTGAFAIPCAKQGASEVLCIDSSAAALDILTTNAKLNHCEQIKSLQGDALSSMLALYEKQEKFDVIILDPPAMIKKKKDIVAGSKMYQKLNEAALNLLSDNGVLLSASCSMQLSGSELLNILRKASIAVDKELSILEHCHQAADHPIHPAISETRYLKGFIACVSRLF